MDHTACTEPQYLYSIAIPLLPSVSVQGCTLPFYLIWDNIRFLNALKYITMVQDVTVFIVCDVLKFCLNFVIKAFIRNFKSLYLKNVYKKLPYET